MKHLLSTADLSAEKAIEILDTSLEMLQTQSREQRKLPTLRGKTVVNLFFEDSTRTRISFEAAAKRLSADVINFSSQGSSVSKGESLKDTAQTLEAMGADAVIVRHSSSGAAHLLANRGWISASVINAGDGTHEHPTQALLDAFTLRSRFAELAGKSPAGIDLKDKKVMIVGDILHSRVARSNISLLSKLGAKVYVVAPSTLLPIADTSPITKSFVNFDLAIREVEPDAVMMLRLQSERMRGTFFPSAKEFTSGWGLTAGRFAALPKHTLVMHPGPMNRGVEISSVAADSERSTIIEQVANGVAVRMAVLYHTLSGGTK